MTELPRISFLSQDSKPQASTAIYFVAEGEGPPAHLKKLDASTGGAISKAMDIAAFKRKRKSVVEILAPHGLAAARLLLVGVGDAKTLNAREWMEIGGAVRGKLPAKTLEADVIFEGVDPSGKEAPAAFALGFGLRNYAFKKYKSKKSVGSEAEESEGNHDAPPPRLTIFSKWGGEPANGFQKNEAVLEGVYLARDLVNEPANILTPPHFVERLRRLEAEGLKVEVLDERALKSLGMNAMLAVGQGSAQPSAAVVLRWEGAPKAANGDGNLVFVGKGVCFELGRHLDQARARHGGHEGRHGGSGRGCGRHAGAGPAQGSRRRHRACRPCREYAERHRPAGPATWSPPHRGKPSRS